MLPFREVLAYLESHDWALYRIHPPYRVFYKHGSPSTGLPILVEVVDGQVDEDVFERVRNSVEGERGEDADEA